MFFYMNGMYGHMKRIIYGFCSEGICKKNGQRIAFEGEFCYTSFAGGGLTLKNTIPELPARGLRRFKHF